MKTLIATVLSTFFAMAVLVLAGEINPPVQNLPQWKDRTIQEMIKDLGTPSKQLSYTIGSAPTKGWNHGIIFSVYPKDRQENLDVTIKEYVWDQEKYEVRACCHFIKKVWVVMGAAKIDKSVRF